MCSGFIQNRSQRWPSKSSKPQLYMKPMSSGSLIFRAPSEWAFSARAITSSLVEQEKAKIASVEVDGAIGLSMKAENFACSMSMT